MDIITLPVNAETLSEYSILPSSLEVKTKLSIKLLDDGFEGTLFTEIPVENSYLKDYDELDGEGPTRWAKSFDTSNWVLFLARKDDIPIGGATVAFKTPEVFMLGGREDIAVVWDIRVDPKHQRLGVGSALFHEAAKWAKERGCKYFKVETQNDNVPACRFYVSQGCQLGEINRFAYTGPLMDRDIMLVWYLDL